MKLNGEKIFALIVAGIFALVIGILIAAHIVNGNATEEQSNVNNSAESWSVVVDE